MTSPRTVPRSRRAALKTDSLACQWGTGAVPSSARQFTGSLALGLDVRDLTQILGDHLGAELPNLLRAVINGAHRV
jgi:hypothetical protein